MALKCRVGECIAVVKEIGKLEVTYQNKLT